PGGQTAASRRRRAGSSPSRSSTTSTTPARSTTCAPSTAATIAGHTSASRSRVAGRKSQVASRKSQASSGKADRLSTFRPSDLRLLQHVPLHPLPGADRGAGDADLPVEVRAGGEAGGADEADHVAGVDGLPDR